MIDRVNFMEKEETLIKSIKQQAEVFLLDAREFFPFATYIDNKNGVVPFSAYIEDENDRSVSQPLIDMLERGIRTRINSGKCIIGALAYDVVMTKNHEKFDVMVIRIYENDKFVERYFKYDIYEGYVTFFEVEAYAFSRFSPFGIYFHQRLLTIPTTLHPRTRKRHRQN